MSTHVEPTTVSKAKRSATGRRAKRFPQFRKLPVELQNMVWKEALLEPDYSVIELQYELNLRTHFMEPTFKRRGYDPSSIALACHNAANIWRSLFPPITLCPYIPTTVFRIREETTVLVASCETVLRLYLMSISGAPAAHAATGQTQAPFKPQHVAYMAGGWSYRLHDLFTPTPRFDTPEFLVENLIRIRDTSHNKRPRSTKVIDRALVEIIKEQGPLEKGIFANGSEWMRRIRPKLMAPGVIDFTPGGTQVYRPRRVAGEASDAN